MAHWTENFTVLDTETTGFRSHDRVLEIAFVHFVDFEPREHYSTRIAIGIPIPEEASAVHGIRDADLVGAPTFEEVVPEITTWLTDADGGPLVGHGLSFDLRMLSYSYGELLSFDRPVACSFDYAKFVHPELRTRRKGHKVLDLLEYFEIEHNPGDAHSALADAMFTGRFVPKLFAGTSENGLMPMHRFVAPKPKR